MSTNRPVVDPAYHGTVTLSYANGPEPCVEHRNKDQSDDEVITVDAPAGDPHITF